jgi:hypothetical protein
MVLLLAASRGVLEAAVQRASAGLEPTTLLSGAAPLVQQWVVNHRRTR